MVLAEKLSNCEKSTFVLNIQQSGMFLNASLLSNPTNKEISTGEENKLSLNGTLNNNSLSLLGKVDKINLCNAKDSETHVKVTSQNHSFAFLKLQASLVPQGGFSGQIILNDVPKPIKFNAIPQKL